MKNKKKIEISKLDSTVFLYIFITGENIAFNTKSKKGKRKVQGVPESQTAALPGHQEEEETDKTKQGQIEQTYEQIEKAVQFH